MMFCLSFPRVPVAWLLVSWAWLGLLCAGLVWLEFGRRTPRRADLVFLLLLAGLVAWRRLPLLFYNQEINIDESQVLAQALTLRHDPVYWRSTDGATMGPLSSYVMALPAVVGRPIDYLHARWVGLGLLLVSLVGAFFTLKNFFGDRAARLAILPAGVLLAFTQYADFVHVTNEQLSLALLGLALWQLSRLVRHPLPPAGGWYALGLLCGAVPFAKLQGVPPALAVATGGAAWLLTRRPVPVRSGVAMLLGGLTFPAAVVGLVAAFGLWGDFVQFYLRSNAAYGIGDSLWGNLGRAAAMAFGVRDVASYLLLPGAAFLGGWAVAGAGRLARPRLLLFLLGLLAASWYAVAKPGNAFHHYLLYLVVPITLLYGWLATRAKNPWLAAVLGGLVLAAVGASVLHTYRGDKRYNRYESAPGLNRPTPQSALAGAVLRYAQPGEGLAVWGWAPRFNVQTQMPQGVCDNHVIRLVYGTPASMQVHRDRYLRNLRQNRPPVFVDAVGPASQWLTDTASFRHERIPELAAYVRQQYTFAGRVDDCRVYVRNDRALPPTLAGVRAR